MLERQKAAGGAAGGAVGPPAVVDAEAVEAVVQPVIQVLTPQQPARVCVACAAHGAK